MCPINIDYYVNITSVVGAAEQLPARQLIPMFFDDNVLVPSGSYVNFPNLNNAAANVAAYFGASSAEYKRALFAFGWVSKTGQQVPSISFARWNSVACAPVVYGDPENTTTSVGVWNSITSGAFNFQMGELTKSLTALDFSSAGSLAAVAAILQTAIRADSYPIAFTGQIDITFPGVFTGVITTNLGVDTLTVTGLTGTISVGDTIAGAGVSGGTTVTVDNMDNTYILSSSGQTISSESMTAGDAFNLLTASGVTGTLAIGITIAGVGVAGGTTITALGTGTGGAGTYILSTDNQTVASEAMTSGTSSPLWASATVTYNSTAGRFIITGGATGPAAIALHAASVNDCAANFGFASPSTILGPGAAVQTITQTLNSLVAINNNFASFGFIATLTTEQITEAATVNAGYNNMFMYSIPCTTATATAIQTAVSEVAGCTTTLTIDQDTTQFEEMDPMLIGGATNYGATNGTQNFMFQQFPGQVPAITTDAGAATYDGIKVNYYANTQDNGQTVNLYQRGVMNGGASAPAAQNTYFNEVWFKSSMQTALMNLLLALSKISANLRGQSQVLASVQSVIQQAVTNGTISVGRTLTTTEKLYITNATGDNTAWQQVQNIGFWVTTTITQSGNPIQYTINYTLIYAADDVVNKIVGTDIQI